MTPKLNSPGSEVFERDGNPQLPDGAESPPGKKEYKLQIVWRNVAYMTYFHLAALYGVYLMFTSAKLLTSLFACVFFVASGMGITCGAHRLWSHRAFKANFGLRVALMLLNSAAFQDSVYEWVRTHRTHHKFSDTDADPVNPKRGFFFSHVGWVLCRKHPDVFEKGKTVDMSDILQDPVVAFQKKYYKYLMPVLCFGFPTVVPVLLWGETWSNAYHVAAMLRYVYLLHCVFFVNSAAHAYGNRPYDKAITPSENLAVTLMTLGEGWHNYHHTFPWDYRSSEWGYFRFNFTTRLIDFCAMMGWAHDLKSTSLSLVQQRAKRTGDGSHYNPYFNPVWGWGDKDMTKEELNGAIIVNKMQESRY